MRMPRLTRGRSLAAGLLITAAALTLPTVSAQAMPTLPCNQKGTSGNDTIDVSVPTGRTDPWVVCAGAGIDTININYVETGAPTPSKLYLSMGAGQKTVNWNAGTLGGLGWGSYFMPWGPVGYTGEGIIVRPTASPDIIQGGSNSGAAVGFICGTNAQYVAAANQLAFYLSPVPPEPQAYYLAWGGGSTSNTLC